MYAGLRSRQEKPAKAGLPKKGILPSRGYAGDPYFCGITEANAIVAVFNEIDQNPIQNRNHFSL